MARETHDVFMREFFDHPGWETVFESLEELVKDMKEQVIISSYTDFLERKGRLTGVYETISQLKTLMKSYTDKG